jgi:hypothetical protein
MLPYCISKNRTPASDTNESKSRNEGGERNSRRQ